VLLLTLSVFTLALTSLLLPSAADTVTELAATFPERLDAFARKLSIPTGPGANTVSRVHDAMIAIRNAEAAIAFVLCFLCVIALVFAARIVTLFEIVQGALHNLAILLLVVGIGLIGLGVVGQQVLTLHSERVDISNGVQRAVRVSMVGLLVLGTLLLPSAFVGLTGAHLESRKALLVFEIVLIPQALTLFIMGLLISAGKPPPRMRLSDASSASTAPTCCSWGPRPSSPPSRHLSGVTSTTASPLPT